MKINKHLSGFVALSAAFALLTITPSPKAAEGYIDIDLSKPEVELTASFDGAELLLFGIHNPGTDVIIVVRGPGISTPVRKKDRVAGIWVNSDEVVFKNAPTFYATASTAPPAEILSPKILSQYEIGVENINLDIESKSDGAEAKPFVDGLIRNMNRSGLYSSEVLEINKVGRQLFRTNLWFPSNVSVGDYTVDTHLVKDGNIINSKKTHIVVHKVGIEADIYNFAHDYSLFYGLLAIVIAVISGWSANAVFRRGG